MYYGNAVRSYQKTEVETADTLSLVIMCYDAALADIKDAKGYHLNGAMDAAYDKIRHAQDLVTELLVGLDFQRGGEIAVNLSKLYNFILRQLIGINSKQDASIYDGIAHIMTELKGAWEQIRDEAAASATKIPTPTRQNFGLSV